MSRLGPFETRCSLLCFGIFLQFGLLDGLCFLMQLGQWGPACPEPSSLLGTKEQTVCVVLASIVYLFIVVDAFNLVILNSYGYKVLVTILFVLFLQYYLPPVWPSWYLFLVFYLSSSWLRCIWFARCACTDCSLALPVLGGRRPAYQGRPLVYESMLTGNVVLLPLLGLTTGLCTIKFLMISP